MIKWLNLHVVTFDEIIVGKQSGHYIGMMVHLSNLSLNSLIINSLRIKRRWNASLMLDMSSRKSI